MIGNKTLKRVEEYIYLGQTVIGNPAHDGEIKRRIGMGWTALLKHGYIMKSNKQLSFKTKGIQPVHPSSANMRLGDLAPYKRTRTKTEE